MKVSTARNICREWVLKNAPVTGEVTGAFFHGSINWKTDDEELPSSSDVDIVLVTDQLMPAIPKFAYRDLILDVSNMIQHEIKQPAQVLDKYYLSGDFKNNNIIYDTQNKLSSIQQAVEKVYYQREQVIHRCQLAMNHAKAVMKTIATSTTLPDRFTARIFSRGILTHVLLNAAVQNPTVRKRYLDTKILLHTYDSDDLYEVLLRLQGFDRFSENRTREHLRSLSEVFDIAASVIRSPYKFAGEITAYAKRIAIGGSDELITAGHHREALFWICASFSRCMHVINQDCETASQIDECQLKFDALINDLDHDADEYSDADITAFDKIVPDVWETAMKIIAAGK